MRKVLGTASLLGVLWALGCGTAPGPYPPPESPDAGATFTTTGTATPRLMLTINHMTFAPQNLNVRPGETVVVQNLDAVPHSVTSEATPGTFTPGEVDGVSFDTGPFQFVRTFTIPLTAAPGTVIPYYDSVYLRNMANEGQITIVR